MKKKNILGYCPYCGRDLPSDFCGHCQRPNPGAPAPHPLVEPCPECGLLEGHTDECNEAIDTLILETEIKQ